MATEDPERIIIPVRPKTFSKEQKMGLGVFVSVGALATIFGLFYISSHLASPFKIDYDGPLVYVGEEYTEQQLIELQQKDTDGDGLNDYEELYVYSTSPYLEDTDGDDLSDYTEITSGRDPNCITGEDCEQDGLFQEGDVGIGIGDLTDAQDPSLMDATGAYTQEVVEASEAAQSTVDILISNFSIEDIRSVLSEAIPAEEVSQMSDEEATEFFRQTLEQMEADGRLDELLAES